MKNIVHVPTKCVIRVPNSVARDNVRSGEYRYISKKREGKKTITTNRGGLPMDN